ncbi:MAG: tetratricopeptide repeat protein [Mucilaginibacter sp.]|nr:tetratricopeptide repeat protein [Mucilaginibacter sp.]
MKNITAGVALNCCKKHLCPASKFKIRSLRQSRRSDFHANGSIHIESTAGKGQNLLLNYQSYNLLHMKKALVLLALITCFAGLYGQELRIKKVQQDLKEHTQADTLRVNRLNELPNLVTLPVGKLDTMANEALSISRKVHYDQGEVAALITLARVTYRKNNLPRALALMQQAITLAEKIKDKTHLSDAYAALSGLNIITGEGKQALAYALKAVAVAQTTPDKRLIARRQISLSGVYANSVGDYTKAMEWALKGEQSAEEANDLEFLALAWSAMGSIYTPIGDQANALIYYKKALAANKKLGNRNLEFNLLNHIGEMYRLSGNYPEAIKAYQEGLSRPQTAYNTELTESNMADVYVRLGNLPMAFKYAFKSLSSAKQINDTEGEEWIDGILARAYLKSNKPDSAIYYAHIGYQKANHSGTIEFKRDNSEALTNAYALKRDFANAYKYHILFISYRDSMSSAQVTSQTSLLQYNYSLARKQAQITALNQDKQAQRYLLRGASIVLGLIIITAIILLRNNRQKQKANNLLSKQKQMIEQERDKTNKALADLQLTQKQLVQSEKMASLGELTAGIAHEIQNPLNFVNNFSEVCIELLHELTEEAKSGNHKEVTAIAGDLSRNLEKINHHGKRADFIVKGMLQHSRTGTGERQLTNINVLADEFFKLSYHGLRAKNKSFNAELATHFDPDLPKINAIPQDIGRVMLNLFNNAFYAVNQKQKTAGADYKPEVTVITSAENGQVIIKVKDNGNGIPDSIKDKIMQPFFTTKPTGEGTGLGLSLTYDMVVKGHGGKIDINTKEGEYTEFKVVLPLS